MKNKPWFEYLLGWSFLVISFLGCILTMNNNPFSNFLPKNDSSMFIYFGKGMADGLTPYVDMFDHKGIVLFILQRLGIFLGQGNDTLGVWFVEVFSLLIAFLFLVKTIKLFTKSKIIPGLSIYLLSWVLISSAEGWNYSETHSLVFISIALFLFSKLILFDKISKIELVIIGIMGGVTFFIRGNMIGLWLVFCLSILCILIYEKKFKNLLTIAGYIFIGGSLICLLVLVYGLINNNLSEMIYQSLILNAQYSSGDGIVGKFTTITSFAKYMSETYVLLFSAVSIFCFGLFNKKIQQLEKRFFVLIIIYTIVNFGTVIISGRDYPHYFVTMIPPLVVMFSLTLTWLQRYVNKTSLSWLAFALVIFSLGASLNQGYQKMISTNISNTNTRVDSTIVHISDYIRNNSDKNDNIYTHVLSGNIYLLSGRYSSTKFFALPSLDYTDFPNLQKEFRDDLKNNPPVFVAIRKELVEEANPLNDRRMNKTVVDLIHDGYKLVPEFKNTYIRLYQKK